MYWDQKRQYAVICIMHMLTRLERAGTLSKFLDNVSEQGCSRQTSRAVPRPYEYRYVTYVVQCNTQRPIQRSLQTKYLARRDAKLKESTTCPSTGSFQCSNQNPKATTLLVSKNHGFKFVFDFFNLIWKLQNFWHLNTSWRILMLLMADRRL